MFSKITALCLAFVMLGCAREKDPFTKPVAFSPKGGSDCLGSAPKTLSDYLHARLNASEVDAFWTCAAKAVADYQRLTNGDLPGSAYSPQALRHFIEHYFLSDQVISDSLLNAIMDLKRVLISGNTSEVTQYELSRAQDFLSEMKALSLELNPYMSVLSMQKGDASDQEIADANAHMRSAMARFGIWISDNRQAYTFDQMRELLGALQGSLGDSAQIEKVLLLLPDVKHLLVNGSTTGIAPEEWPKVIVNLARGYGFYVSMHYAFQKDLNAGLVRESIPNTLADVADTLSESLASRPDGVIPQSEFNQLFDKIEQTQWLPSEFTAKAMGAAWTWFLTRPLGRAADPGLTPAHVARLRQQSIVWKNLLAYVHGEGASRGHELTLFESVRDASVPLEWDSEGRMIFPVQAAPVWTAQAQEHLVWPFVIINWIKESYVGVDATSLTAEQMDSAVGEILPLLQSFGWMKETKVAIGRRILREADLFTSASNGNQVLDLSEGVRYLTFVASSLRSAQVWLAEADRLCGGREAKCVRTLPLKSETVFAPFPHLKAALLSQKNPNLALRRYILSAEEIVLGQDVTGDYTTGGMLQTWVIYSYIETFLRNYDLDQSETISLPEAEQVYKVFGPTLVSLLNGKVPPDQVYGFFTFLMKYGDTPEMFGGQILYIHWLRHQPDWSVNADRTILMGILNQLSKQ